MTDLPKNWNEIYGRVVRMRAVIGAPVDTMGPDMLTDTTADHETQRFQILIALILSPQTRDYLVAATMRRLHEKTCTVDVMADMATEDLEELVKGVSFFKRKATYIKATSVLLRSQHNSRVPQSSSELLKLPGVGAKVVGVFTAITGQQSSIGIDTHLSRIFQRWQFTTETKPDLIARDVQQWLPRELWKDVNQLIVGFGQTVCGAIKPLCDGCLLRSLCPSSRSTRAVTTETDIEDLRSLRNKFS